MAEGVCRFGVLGPLTLERDGEPVALPMGQVRALLALLLAAAGEPLSRDRLIDELWGERPPATSVSALHVYLSRLRALLGDALQSAGAGYWLNMDDAAVDAHRFEALVDEARREPSQAGARLREALALFRGEPLAEIHSDGMVAQWRRALSEQRLHAVMMRIDADLAAGGAGELVAELERLLAAHPFEERLWGQLMLALFRGGRQADALDAYQRARRTLAEELGLDPGPGLARLQQQVLERDPALLAVAPGRAESPAPATRPPSNVPVPATRLVGRESELEALASLAAETDVRLITLTGPGGVGKTRLALELARLRETAHADGAIFVGLDDLSDAALISSQVATALAQRDGVDALGPDRLAGYLHDRDVLILLDNFEHLLSAAPAAAELVAAGPGVRVLATSRAPLRLRGEHVFELEPLALPDSEMTSAIALSPAVELFVQCALAARRDLELDADAMRDIADICRGLDGLPLAIELAASRLGRMSTDEMREQLVQPLAIGEYALRDLPDRHQTLHNAIAWSYDLLAPPEQETLRCAAVFLGGFARDALEAVIGRPAGPETATLLEASLVRRAGAERRYALRELVRAFASQRLEAAAEDQAVRARHRRHFAVRAAAASGEFDGGRAPGEIAAGLLADHANLRAALEDAIGAGDEESALALALGLRPLWLAGMLRQEAAQLTQRLLERFTVPAESELALLSAVGFAHWQSREWYRRIAERADELGHRDTLTMATLNLFGQAMNAREMAEIRRLKPVLTDLITPEASARARGWVHYYLALAAFVDGDFEQADEQAALSIAEGEEIGHDYLLAVAVATKLMVDSSRLGEISQPALARALELVARPAVKPMSAFGLWLAASYAATLAPERARRWLAHAERMLAEAQSDAWPESTLRDATMAELGISDLAELVQSEPPIDDAAALAEAASWVAERDPSERAPRPGAAPVAAPGG